MPDRFKPHNYLDWRGLGAIWDEWSNEHLTVLPDEDAQRESFYSLFPVEATLQDIRSRDGEFYGHGMLRGRLAPPQTNRISGTLGWEMLRAGEHVHTPLGYLYWLLNAAEQQDSSAIYSARFGIYPLLAIQWYVERNDGSRISYLSLFEWLKGKFPRPTEVSRIIWLQTIAAAMFCTTKENASSNNLIADLLSDTDNPRLILVWNDGRRQVLTASNFGVYALTQVDYNTLILARALNYWIGKEPEVRGVYSLSENIAPQFFIAFAAEEIRLLRNNGGVCQEPFRTILYKNHTEETPDIIGLLPELATLPALTQPTLDLMKTLREGAIEAIQQLYGPDAAAEIKLPVSGTPPPLPLDLPHQKILFGPPGTGKSTQAKRDTAGHAVVRTTFHPDTDYASFVGAYKPVKVENDITYEFRPQVFAETYWAAWQEADPHRAHFLLIEEINRGNCAQIFGDLFQALDRDPAGYSAYPVRADADLAQWLRAKLAAADAAGHPELRARYVAALAQADVQLATPADAGQWLLLPPNLYLYATMNTSDQSLFPMDSAFKRRWAWEYVPIDYAPLREPGKEVVLDLGMAGRYAWADFLETVNQRIQEFNKSEDKQLGPWFVQPRGGVVGRAEFEAKVLFYLWSDIYKLEPDSDHSIFRYRLGKDEPPQAFTFADLYAQGAATKLRSMLVDTLALTELPPAAASDPAAAPAPGDDAAA